MAAFALVSSGTAFAAPVTMLRLTAGETENTERWAATFEALKANPGCCNDVWFSTGESFPSLEHHRDHAAKMAGAVRDVRSLGIGASLQLEASIGHGDGFITEKERRDFDRRWTGWTGPAGVECRYCNCPRQPAFLERIAAISEIYAAVKPDVLWIDDDLRKMNHGPGSPYNLGTEDAKVGCWCDRCVADFCAKEGVKRGRAELHTACLADAALAARWRTFSEESLAAMARVVAETFRRLSPETKMGLQFCYTPPFDTQTRIIAKALREASGRKIALRPGAGDYHDLYPVRQLVKSYETVGCRARLDIEDLCDFWCTEVESYPRAYGGRSARSAILEGFSGIAWGLESTSWFLMDWRSEESAFYSRYLLKPLAAGTALLDEYARVNEGTVPAGYEAGGNGVQNLLMAGVPVLSGKGRSWGKLANGAMPSVTTTGSGRIQSARDALDAGDVAPVRTVSPFVGTVAVRVTEKDELRSIALIGTRLDPQENVRFRVKTAAERVRWHELGKKPVELAVERDGGSAFVTVPSIDAWGAGFLAFGPETGRTSFRFASWNVGHFALGNMPCSNIAPEAADARGAVYRAFLDQVGADVLGISEYSPDFCRGGSVSAETAVFAGYDRRVIGKNALWRWNSVFWKGFAALESRSVDFTVDYPGLPETLKNMYYVKAAVKIAGKRVVFVQTHLAWEEARLRRGQMEQLIRELADEPRVVIAGDFNVGINAEGGFAAYLKGDKRVSRVAKSGEYELFLAAGYTPGNDESFLTAPAGNRRYPLDNIIVKGLVLRDFRVMDRPDLSDHALVTAVLEFDL